MKEMQLSICIYCNLRYLRDYFVGVMFCVLTTSVVDHEFDRKSDKPKDKEIWCYFLRHATLKSKTKD
jgi:hypothetical protein